MPSLKISLRLPEEYLANSVALQLDKQWDRDAIGRRAGQKGIYIIFTQNPTRIIYIRKTRGAKMDFATRRYRHATKAASSNSKVYRELKKTSKESSCPIRVALITTRTARNHFSGESIDFNEAAMIDTLEQVLIHYLHPKVQESSESR